MFTRRVIPSILFALLLVVANLPASAGGDEALTDEQRRLNLESFDYVWTTIGDKHWEEQPGGLDWNAVRDEFRPRVEQA